MTAVGGMALLLVAKRFGGELVSDSQQVYRRLDIGAAKVAEEQMADPSSFD